MTHDALRALNVKKNVIFAVLAFGINIGLVFLSYRLVIRQSGLEILGLWSTLYAWTTMIRLGDVGMANASLRFVALCDPVTETEKLNSYLETGILSNALFYIALGLIGYVLLAMNVDRIVQPRFVAEAGKILPVMMAAFVMLNISGVLMGSLQGLHLGYLNSQLSVAGNLVQIVFVFILVPRLGLSGLAWAQVSQYGLSIVAAWTIVRNKAGIQTLLPVGFSRSSFLEMLGFSAKAQLANIANGLFEPFSKILVGHFGGLHVLGIYELAFKTVWLPRSAIVGGTTALIPSLTTFFRHKADSFWPLYKKSARYTILGVAFTCISLVCASPLVSWLWLGSLQTDYMIFVTVLSLGIIGNAWGAAAYNLGAVTGSLTNNIIITATTLILLGLSMPLVHHVWNNPVCLIATVAVAMAFGGVTIRFANERLIRRCFCQEVI